jgi:hypothetical protein
LKFWRHQFINLILNFVVGIQFLLFLPFNCWVQFMPFFNQINWMCNAWSYLEGISKVPFQCPLN